MAAITSLATAQAARTLWQDALDAVSTGQTYTIGNRQLTRVEVPLIQQQLTIAQRAVDAYTDAARTDRVKVDSAFRVAAWSGTVT